MKQLLALCIMMSTIYLPCTAMRMPIEEHTVTAAFARQFSVHSTDHVACALTRLEAGFAFLMRIPESMQTQSFANTLQPTLDTYQAFCGKGKHLTITNRRKKILKRT